MCGGSVGSVFDNVRGQVKEATSSKGIKRNLMTGGVSQMVQVSDNGKDLDSLGRKNMLGAAREKGIVPEKKVTVDPAAERAAAAATATQTANMRIAMQRKAMRENSLFTGGGQRSTLGV